MSFKDFRNYATNHLGIAGTTVDSVVNYIESSMTPMILEERQMNVISMSVFDRLMKDRILWMSGPVDERMSSIVCAQLLFLDSVDKNKDITMQISSPGGSVLSGLSIVDVMNYINCDVSTINIGMAASMGSVLLSSGKKGKRHGLIFSKVMTHMVSHGYSGNIQDTRINQIESEKYNFILFKILAENCNKTFDEIFEISRHDRWFNSDEALNFGLIDEVIGTDKNKNISSMLEGFEDYYKKEVLNII